MAGEIDLSNEQLFATRLARAMDLAPAVDLTIDTSGLEFIGHRALLSLEYAAESRNGTITMRNAPPIVERLVDLLRLNRLQVEARGSVVSA